MIFQIHTNVYTGFKWINWQYAWSLVNAYQQMVCVYVLWYVGIDAK